MSYEIGTVRAAARHYKRMAEGRAVGAMAEQNALHYARRADVLNALADRLEREASIETDARPQPDLDRLVKRMHGQREGATMKEITRRLKLAWCAIRHGTLPAARLGW